jgi:hypothetical protein
MIAYSPSEIVREIFVYSSIQVMDITVPFVIGVSRKIYDTISYNQRLSTHSKMSRDPARTVGRDTCPHIGHRLCKP